MASAKQNVKPKSQAEVIKAMAEMTEMPAKDIKKVIDALGSVVERELGSAGLVNIFGLMKVKIVHKPAVPAGERMDPFSKTKKMYPAKPARKAVKCLALKKLKDMV